MVKRIPEPVRAEDEAPFEERRRVYILPILLKALSLAALGLFLTGCPDPPRRQVQEDVNTNFTDNPVGGSVAPCPAAGALVRFVDDGGNPATTSATVKNTLEVSNRVTTADLPTGFTDASTDRDNFKVEVLDATVTGSSIPATSVEVEALKPSGTAFSPRRKINVELQRVGTSNLFRSKYLRLVVDDQDNGANTAQTLLTDWDSSDESITILGQIVKVTYTSSCGPLTSQTTVGSATRSYVRVAIRAMRTSPGGSPVVTAAQATTRIKKWFRRVLAQISMTPDLITAFEVDPLENLISISNDHGRSATGGTASRIQFTIRSVRSGAVPGAPDLTQAITYTPVAGHTPMQTANAIAALIRAQPNFSVTTVQNPPTLEPTITQGSADIILHDPIGGRIRIESPSSSDATQTIDVGVVNVTNFGSWFKTPTGGGAAPQNWVVGSIQQRTLLNEYDTGSDRVDIFVIGTLDTPNRGQAMFPGSFYAAGKQAIPQVTRSAFVNANTMDGTDNDCYNTIHEVAHVMIDAVHVQGDPTQLLMGSGTSMTHVVGGSKRFSESAVTFDGPAITVVQETRMRAQGAPLLHPFP